MQRFQRLRRRRLAQTSWMLLLASLTSCAGGGQREAPAPLRNIQIVSKPPGVEIYRQVKYGRSDFTLVGVTPFTLDGVSGKTKIGAYKDRRIIWMDVDPSAGDKLEFDFNESTTTWANRADVLKLGNEKALREWDGIKISSTPPGVEVYCPDKYGIQMEFAGATPVSIKRPESKAKIALYKDKRVMWLELNPGPGAPINVDFNDTTTQVAAKADLYKMGNQKALQSLEIEEDLAEGRQRGTEDAKVILSFKDELKDAPDAKTRIQRIRVFLDKTYELTDSVLGLYASTWSSAIEHKDDFSIEISRLQIRLMSKGILAQLSQRDKAIKEAFDSLKPLPEEMKSAFDVLADYYGIFSEAHSLADKPTGSLVTFRQRKDALASGAKQKSGKLEILAR